MPIYPFQSGQGSESSTLPRRRSRRQPRATQFPRAGLLRPGRFFKKRPRLIAIRSFMKPVHLGESDWLLYRRRFNPYPSYSFKAAAYERGFVSCKRMFPSPRWPPI